MSFTAFDLLFFFPLFFILYVGCMFDLGLCIILYYCRAFIAGSQSRLDDVLFFFLLLSSFVFKPILTRTR